MSQYQKDPYPSLPSELIGIIIEHLPKENTETLRRLSKHWKALSEYHCTHNAIKQHFPGTEAAQRTFESNEEANLTFRRLLYQEESIKKGYITRVHRYSDVAEDLWHLNGDSLLWIDTDDLINIENLRDQKSKVSLERSTWWPNGEEYLVDAFLTANGYVLIAVQRDMADEDRYECRFNGLAKVSCQGHVCWEIQFEASVVAENLHMGADMLYYTSDRKSASSWESFFVTRSLENGDLLCETKLPFMPYFNRQNRVPLNQSKRWALVVGWEGSILPKRVIDTSTGSPVFRDERWGDFDFAFSAVNDKFWNFRSLNTVTPNIICYEYQYNPEEDTTILKTAYKAKKPEGACWGFDGDQQLLFHIEEIEQQGQVEHSGSIPHTVFVTPLIPRHPSVEEPEMAPRRVPMSLPADPKRRNPEFGLSTSSHNTIQLINGYLLLHDRHRGGIILLDFWPAW